MSMLSEKSVEQIEDEIAVLASSIAATTAQVLERLAELHRRERWSDGFASLAHWLSWRTGLDLGAAREHVRVAVALGALPTVREALARGELSYAKVRAITRVARPESEAVLVNMARHASASQLEKIVRGVRRVDHLSTADRQERVEASRMCQAYFDDDGMLVVRARLAPEEGALVLRALDEACKETEHDRAAALALVADRSLAADRSRAGHERVQVVVHVDAEVLRDRAPEGRSQLADGPAVSAETSRRLACDATVTLVADDQKVGRKKRLFAGALRQALDLRDHAMCRFPGCTTRRVDAHHVVHWADGGATTLENGCLMCRRHHTLVHEGGWSVTSTSGTLRFFRPNGTELRNVPPLPRPEPLARAGDAYALMPVDYTPTPDYGWAVEDVLNANALSG